MTDQLTLPQRNGVSVVNVGKPFLSIVLAACTAALSSIGMPTAQAKQECSSAMPTDSRGYWSWRLIDGQKCWYEGKQGLSKSLLEWPKVRSKQLGSSTEVPGAVSENPGYPIARAPKGNWPRETSEQPGSGKEVTGAITEEPGNPLDSKTAPEGSDTLGRFGDWTITKNDAVITLRSDTGNLALRCSDAAMTYLAFIRISGRRSIAGPAEIKRKRVAEAVQALKRQGMSASI